MSNRLLRSSRALRIATLDHGGAAGTAAIRVAGSASTPPATGGCGSAAPWLPAPLSSAAPGWRAAREQGLPSAGQA